MPGPWETVSAVSREGQATIVAEGVERTSCAIRYLGLVGGLAAVFATMAMVRLVDGDEGTYLLVARRVMEGALPFHDLFTIALGTLLYAEMRRLTGRPALAWLAAGALGFNSLALGWFPLVKTYAPATLLLFSAIAILEARGSAARPLVSTPGR